MEYVPDDECRSKSGGGAVGGEVDYSSKFEIERKKSDTSIN